MYDTYSSSRSRGPNYTDGPAVNMLAAQYDRKGFGHKIELSKNQKRKYKRYLLTLIYEILKFSNDKIAENPLQPKTAVQFMHERYPIVKNLIQINESAHPDTGAVEYECVCDVKVWIFFEIQLLIFET